MQRDRRVKLGDEGQVAIALPMIQPIAHNELVWKIEASVLEGNIGQAPSRPIQQRSYLQAGGMASAKHLQDVVQGEAGIYDILDDQKVLPLDAGFEVFHYADDA